MWRRLLRPQVLAPAAGAVGATCLQQPPFSVRCNVHHFDAKAAARGHAAVPGKVDNFEPGLSKVYRIVLTGGPCGGKSSALAALQESLTKKGYDVYAVPEVPTILLNGGCVYPGLNGGKKLEHFETGLIQLQLQIERSFTLIAASTGRPSVVVMDRGLMDIAAYLPPDAWAKVLKANDMTEEYCLSRYDGVVHLVTAADGAEAFYKWGETVDDSGNKVTRNEPPEVARELDEKIRGCWKSHPHLGLITNGEDGFKGKLDRVNRFMSSLVRERNSRKSRWDLM